MKTTGLAFTLVLGGVTGLTAVSIDIMLPALGVIAVDRGVDAADGALLVSVYFVAYALGQLFWGPVSDRVGRRPAVIAGLLAFSVLSVVCAFAPSFEVLLAARFAQGLAGAVPVVARAVVRDVASGAESARMMSTLTSIVAVAPLLAPALGSGLLVLFDWQAIFLFLAVLALAYVAAFLRYVPETRTVEAPGERPGLRSRLKFLATSREFVTGALVSALVFGGYAAVLSMGSVVAAEVYGVSPGAFGSVFAIAACFVIAGSFSTRQLVRRIGLTGVGNLAMAVTCVAGLTHLALALATPDFTTFWGGVCLYVLGFGIVLPSATSFALEPTTGMTGLASSLLGTVQMLTGALVGALVSLAYAGDHVAISAAMAATALTAVTVFGVSRLLARRSRPARAG